MLCKFRRHLALLTAAWFLCQVGAIAATPVAACEMLMADEAELPECCRNLKPGQTCPMHGHAEGQPEHACHLASPCPTTDVALCSLAVAFGLTTAPPLAAADSLASATAVGLTPAPLARGARPEPPPPRL